MSNEIGKKKNPKVSAVLCTVLMILTPVIISLLYAAFWGIIKKADPFPGIIWNDEAVYLKLIENYAKHLSPLGYWGFNANHAILGSGPAWSPAIILPYALLAKIFPTGQSFVFFANLFFMVLANLVFWLLARPEREQNVRLIGFQLFFVPLLLYLTTNMSEIYRYAIAVVLAGMLYYLYFAKQRKWWISYLIIPLFFLYSVQVYTFFAFAIPLYVCALLKEKKGYIRFLVSLPVTAIVAGGSYYFLHLISSNYNIGKTESLLAALSAKDFAGAVKSALYMAKDGLLGVWELKNYFKSEPIYPYSVILALVMIGVGLFMAFRGKANPEKKDDAYLGRMIAHSVALFYAMYMTLYTILPDTFYRGTQIVILFSLYLLAMCKREYLVRLLLLVSLAGVFLSAGRFRYFTADRYAHSAVQAEWNTLRNDWEKVLKADPSKDKWENTILMYTMEPKAICAVPVGPAENFVLEEGTFSENPEYLLFSKLSSEEANPEWIVRSYERIYTENRDVLDKNYIVIYETDSYIIYKKGQK